MGDFKRGVRQGCVLSPDLFTLYGEVILREIEEVDGLKIGGRVLNNIRYADDTVLVADSMERLQELVNVVNAASEEKGLKINREKTECMVVPKKSESPECLITIGQDAIRKVEQFQ